VLQLGVTWGPLGLRGGASSAAQRRGGIEVLKCWHGERPRWSLARPELRPSTFDQFSAFFVHYSGLERDRSFGLRRQKSNRVAQEIDGVGLSEILIL